MLTITMPFLGFVLLFLELYLLITIGRGIGFAPMLAEILLTGVAGYSLMRFLGRTAFQPAQLIGVFLHAGGKGLTSRKPVEWLLFGSLLLIIPGVITDILGIIFIVRYLIHGGPLRQPPSRSDAIDIEFDVRDDDTPT